MIKVTKENENKIQFTLDEAQKRCRVRTASASDVFKTVEYIEREFNIPKTHMKGLVIRVDLHADKYPNAYEHRPQSTQFTLTRKSGGWYVCDIERDWTGGTTNRYKVITMPEETKAALVNRFMRF